MAWEWLFSCAGGALSQPHGPSSPQFNSVLTACDQNRSAQEYGRADDLGDSLVRKYCILCNFEDGECIVSSPFIRNISDDAVFGFRMFVLNSYCYYFDLEVGFGTKAAYTERFHIFL